MSVQTEKLEKLTKVLGFYQQNLQILKGRLRAQAGVVAEKQLDVSRWVGELERSQKAFSHTQPTAVGLQMVQQQMATAESGIEQAKQELEKSNRELEARRADLRQQMSKIESFEKIVTRTSAGIEHKRRQLEQFQSDERYLNNRFTGKMK